MECYSPGNQDILLASHFGRLFSFLPEKKGYVSCLEGMNCYLSVSNDESIRYDEQYGSISNAKYELLLK